MRGILALSNIDFTATYSRCSGVSITRYVIGHTKTLRHCMLLPKRISWIHLP